MDEKIVKKIVVEVFEKAKKEHASHSKFALSNHISNETVLSARTLERAYDRYINQKKKYGIPQAESIDLFCKYLGYEDFRDFIKSNPENIIDQKKPIVRNNKQKLIISISIIFGFVLIIFGIQKWPDNRHVDDLVVEKCMTWADSLYVPISCDESPLSKYGTQVKPLDQMELKNMKKVEVHAAYEFFNEENKPLIWYYKNKGHDYEYFTSPGLHPVNGETLKKITTHIIHTYVPLHIDKKESFIAE